MAKYFVRARDNSFNYRIFSGSSLTSLSHFGTNFNKNQLNQFPVLLNETVHYKIDGLSGQQRLFMTTDGGNNYTTHAVNVYAGAADIDLKTNSKLFLSNGLLAMSRVGYMADSAYNIYALINANTYEPSSVFYTSPYIAEDLRSVNYSPNTNYMYFGSNDGLEILEYLGSFRRTISETGFKSFNASSSVRVIPGAGTDGKDIVYACDFGGTMKKSLDSGETWTQISPTSFPLYNGSRFFPKFFHVDGDNILANGYASSSNNLFVYSSDGGVTWSTSVFLAGTNTEHEFTDIEKIGQDYIVTTPSGASFKAVRNNDGEPHGFIQNSSNGINYSGTLYYITDVNGYAVSNTAPTGISLSTNSIAEDAGANAAVGTLSATDAEGGVMAWSLVAGTGDNDNASFEIVGDELRLANGVSLDYEAKSSYAIRVQATDAGGLSFSSPLVINVSNVNEAPSNITLSAASIQEGNAIGDVIGTLGAIDSDGDTSFTFSIVAGGDKFSIEGGSLKAAAVFDYEVATSHSVTVRATDAGGAAFDKVFTISILNDSSDDPQAVSGDQVVSGTGGKAALVSANNPTVSEFTLNGQALAKGSVVRWSGNSNQKFLKIAGDSKAFKAIPLAPPVSWKWDAAGNDAWEVLQGF